MKERTLTRAADYHQGTYYSRAGMSGGGLDWDNKPDPYKKYPGADALPLPRDIVLPKVDAKGILLGDIARKGQPLDLKVLAGLLYMSYGFTSQMDYGHETYLYRSVPSAGALYPVEVYLAARDIPGLDDGLYHYSILDFSLVCLRKGTPPPEFGAPAFILTSLFFRSAWKYKDRAFRYCLLDAGHVAESIIVTSKVMGVDAEFQPDFDDRALIDYLGLDPGKEWPLAMIHVNGGGDRPESEASGTSQAAGGHEPPASEPVAPKEYVFDRITEIADITSARLEREPQPLEQWGTGKVRPLLVDREASDKSPSLVQVFQKRRSRRNFIPKTVHASELGTVLEMVLTPDVGRLINVGLVTNEVEDVADGYQTCQADPPALSLHKGGFIAPDLALTALDQAWVGRANTVAVITAPLGHLEESLGPRALRLAYLAAGRLGQRAYLAAEAMNWGCCGVGAFFDPDVHQLLGLPESEEVLYILPVGPVKMRTHGGRKE